MLKLDALMICQPQGVLASVVVCIHHKTKIHIRNKLKIKYTKIIDLGFERCMI